MTEPTHRLGARGTRYRRKSTGTIWTSSGRTSVRGSGTPRTILKSRGGAYRYPYDHELRRDYEEVTDAEMEARRAAIRAAVIAKAAELREHPADTSQPLKVRAL